MSTPNIARKADRTVYAALDWSHIYDLVQEHGLPASTFYRVVFAKVAAPQMHAAGRIPCLSTFMAHMAEERRRRGAAPAGSGECTVRVARLPDEAFGPAECAGEVRIEAAGATVSFSSAEPALSAALAAAQLMKLMGGAA